MVGSVPRDFTEMDSMGIQLEEGVREGRLVRETAPTNNAKKFENGFSRKKEQEVGMVSHGRPQQNHPAYQHIAPITPVTNTARQPSYQKQYPQQNYPTYQQIAVITPPTTTIHQPGYQPQFQQQPYPKQPNQQHPYQQQPYP